MINNLGTRIRTFTKESIRVLKITKKPNAEEFKVIVKVSGIGIIIIGLIGFIIKMFATIIK